MKQIVILIKKIHDTKCAVCRANLEKLLSNCIEHAWSIPSTAQLEQAANQPCLCVDVNINETL